MAATKSDKPMAVIAANTLVWKRNTKNFALFEATGEGQEILRNLYIAKDVVPEGCRVAVVTIELFPDEG